MCQAAATAARAAGAMPENFCDEKSSKGAGRERPGFLQQRKQACRPMEMVDKIRIPAYTEMKGGTADNFVS